MALHALNIRKTILQVASLVIILLIAYWVSHPAKKGEYISLAGFAQGTTYHITYESMAGENLQAAIDSLLEDFDRSLSIYQPNSLISRINKNDPTVRADQKLITVFEKSRTVHAATEGAFDITVGPIVNALGFGSGDTLLVDSTLIDSLRRYVGMEKVQLQEDRIIKKDPGIILDLNAIAQGYAVDVIALWLEGRGIKHYMVEIGGEVRAKGTNARNQPWRIGIDRPEEGNTLPGADLQAIISLKNRALATSGNYRRFYEKNGVKYVHTIDPNTGYPVISNLLSATVVAEDCITADAYATALMVMGVEKSMAFLEDHDSLDAYLIFSDQEGLYRIFATKRLRRFIEEQ